MNIKKVFSGSYFVLMNIILPVGDIKAIGNSIYQSWKETAQRCKKLKLQPTKNQDKPLSFNEALNASGKNLQQLKKDKWVQKQLILTLFYIVCCALIFINLAAVKEPHLTANSIAKIACFDLMIISIITYLFIKSLTLQYQQWQLKTQRLSSEEKGTFSNFKHETDWFHDTVVLDLKGKAVLSALIPLGLGLLFFHPQLAHAADMSEIIAAATKPTDLSRQMLVLIFGDVVNNPLNPASSSFIGELFFKLNSLIATIAFFYVSAISGKKLVKAGHMGQVFHGGNTMMGPVKTLTGFIALVPTASGWSLAQLLMLWAASIMGVGMGNILADTALNQVLSGKPLIVQTVSPDSIQSATSIYEMDLCLYAYNKQFTGLDNDLVKIKSQDNGFELSNSQFACGQVHIPKPEKSWFKDVFMPQSIIDEQNLFNARMSALHQLQNTLSKAAYRYVNAFSHIELTAQGAFPDPVRDIHQAAERYENTMNNYVQQITPSAELEQTMAAKIKQDGWISLGAWYQTFATANMKKQEAVVLKPVISGLSESANDNVGTLYKKIYYSYQRSVNNSTYTDVLGTMPAQQGANSQSAVDPSSVFVGIFNHPVQQLATNIAKINFGPSGIDSNQMNPLLKMKAIGDYTLYTTEAALGSFIGARAVIAFAKSKSIVGVFNFIFSFGTTDIANSILESLMPLFYFSIFLLFSVSFMLSLYLPFIPFIYWISGVMNWIVSVVVGCISGTLWAATHLGGEDDAGSRANYGYIFLIDVMLRPTLMVFGFFFASVIVVAIGTLFNYLLASAVANMEADSITGIFTLIGILLFYSRMCTILVSRVFSLQTRMPDYVISWLGGRPTESILGDAHEEVKASFVGFAGGLRSTPNPLPVDEKPKDNPGGNSNNGVK